MDDLGSRGLLVWLLLPAPYHQLTEEYRTGEVLEEREREGRREGRKEERREAGKEGRKEGGKEERRGKERGRGEEKHRRKARGGPFVVR